MVLPQPGIFALGTSTHAYLELELRDGDQPLEDVVATAAAFVVDGTTPGGVNAVVGFRPELWADVRPDAAPAGLHGFDAPIAGQDGFVMPATQRDVAVWLAGPGQDVVFDVAVSVAAALAPYADLVQETFGWTYHHHLDLTGFVDGTENPTPSEAPGIVLVPNGEPGAGGSVLLLQKWPHDGHAWSVLPEHEQEQVIGRTKVTDEELEPGPETSHVARTDQDDFGHVLRRNTAFGTVTDHGTMFVGFCATRGPLEEMLRSMAGVGGVRDALTHYSRPITGGYYFVPAADDLPRGTST